LQSVLGKHLLAGVLRKRDEDDRSATDPRQDRRARWSRPTRSPRGPMSVRYAPAPH